jgi:hypothetical protein
VQRQAVGRQQSGDQDRDARQHARDERRRVGAPPPRPSTRSPPHRHDGPARVRDPVACPAPRDTTTDRADGTAWPTPRGRQPPVSRPLPRPAAPFVGLPLLSVLRMSPPQSQRCGLLARRSHDAVHWAERNARLMQPRRHYHPPRNSRPRWSPHCDVRARHVLAWAVEQARHERLRGLCRPGTGRSVDRAEVAST